MKMLENNKIVLGYFNFSESKAAINVYFEDFGIAAESGFGLELTDVMTGENIGKKFDAYCPTLEAHSFRIFKAEFCKR